MACQCPVWGSDLCLPLAIILSTNADRFKRQQSERLGRTLLQTAMAGVCLHSTCNSKPNVPTQQLPDSISGLWKKGSARNEVRVLNCV